MLDLNIIRRELKKYSKELQCTTDSVGCIIKGNILIVKCNSHSSTLGNTLGDTVAISVNTKSIITNDIAVLKLMLDNLSKYNRNKELKRVLKLS